MRERALLYISLTRKGIKPHDAHLDACFLVINNDHKQLYLVQIPRCLISASSSTDFQIPHIQLVSKQ